MLFSCSTLPSYRSLVMSLRCCLALMTYLVSWGVMAVAIMFSVLTHLSRPKIHMNIRIHFEISVWLTADVDMYCLPKWVVFCWKNLILDTLIYKLKVTTIFKTEVYKFQKGLHISRHITKRDFIRDPSNLIAFKLFFAGCSEVGFLTYQTLYLLIE